MVKPFTRGNIGQQPTRACIIDNSQMRSNHLPEETPFTDSGPAGQSAGRVRAFQERIHSLSNSIRIKLILGTLLLVIFYSVGNYLLIKTIVRPGHHALEQSIAQKDMERCISTLNREVQFLDVFATDWAAWDDTYDFIHNSSSDYIASNLPYSTFASNKINLIHYYNREGKLIWGKSFDLETGQQLSLKTFSFSGLPRLHPLLKHQDENSSKAGLLVTDKGAMIVASRPIITSQFEGPIGGTLIFGKLINEWLLKDMEKRIKVPFHYHLINDEKYHYDVPADVALQLDAGNTFGYSIGEQSLEVFSRYRDYQGRDALLLNTVSDRLITGNTNIILHYVLLSNIGVGLLAMVLLLFFHKKMIETVSKMFNISVLMSEIDPQNIEEGLSSIERNIIQLGQQLQYDFIGGGYAGHVLPKQEEEKSVMLWKMNVQLTKEIRERVKAEEALREIQQSLEERVHERTKVLTETNVRLEREIQERKKYQQQMELYQDQLRTLSTELLSIEERERSKIAEDLHDRIGQALSVTRMQIDGLIEEAGDDTIRGQLEKITGTLSQILQDTRTMTFELSPPILYELGLVPALDWLAEQFAEQHSLHVDIDVEELPENASRTCLTLLFRTIRELLINVVRHAQTDRAKVHTHLDGDVLNVSVSDQGVGFTVEKMGLDRRKNEIGFGLFSIQERVKSIGGSFTVNSSPGEGTTVFITVVMPCSREYETEGS